MTDSRKTGVYFKTGIKMKKIMNSMLKTEFTGAKKVISDLKKPLKDSRKAYGEHERLCGGK